MQDKRFHTILLTSTKWFSLVLVLNEKLKTTCRLVTLATSSLKMVTHASNKFHLPKTTLLFRLAEQN